jgi:N-acetylneuraminate synthase
MVKMSVYQNIKAKQSPFIIAEIGVNYYDIAKKENYTTMDAAKLMIKKAYESGADAVKFQSYKADTLASQYSPSYWDLKEETTPSQYELFKKYDKFSKNEYRELAEYCKSIGIMFLSTPFDFDAVDYLYNLMDIYKISSSDITNLPFIKYIAEKNKPIFLSTGASTLGEIELAINEILCAGNKDICIMHCVLSYPTNYENANLNMIKHLQQVFPDYLSGFSDHTCPDDAMLVLLTAWQYGAKVVEKHFTLDKNLPGNDHYHAMDEADLKKFRDNIKLLQQIEGQYYKQPLLCEEAARMHARRSIVAKIPIYEGEIITSEKVTFKRPGTGISPKDFVKIVGLKAKRSIEKDKILQWNDFYDYDADIT